MTAYVVDPLSAIRGTLLATLDRHDVVTDAVFVHGSPAANDAIDAQLLRLAVETSRAGRTGPVVINGLRDEDCRPDGQRLAYPGCDTWSRVLENLGCHDFLMTYPSEHTAAESDALISLAFEQQWKSVTIMSYPHHIARCMMQMVYCLQRAGSDLKVYTKTLPGMNWHQVAEKGVLRQAPFSGTLIGAHVREEYERDIKYADRDGKGYTPQATFEEMIAYYERRDAI